MKDVMYYELLKPNKTVTAEYFQALSITMNRALNQKRPIITQRKRKVILLHDNARHVAKVLEHFFVTVEFIYCQKSRKKV